MRAILMLITLSSIILSGPAIAGADNYATVGDWSVTQTRNQTCYALLLYDEISVALEYDAKAGHVFLFLGNKDATSMSDSQVVSLKIVFTKGEQIDDGWGEQEFTAHVDESETPLFSSNGWFTTEMLTDFSKSDYFMAMNDGKLVSGAKLNQSSGMVAKLRECSIKAANLNPNDPFIP